LKRITFVLTKVEIEDGEILDEKDLTDEQREELEQQLQIEENGCPFQDDTYTADVDYYNPDTGYSNNYT